MKTLNLIVGAGLALVAAGAMAETGTNLSPAGDVSKVYGIVVTRPANEVVPGPNTEQGQVALTVQAKETDVNKVSGRS